MAEGGTLSANVFLHGSLTSRTGISPVPSVNLSSPPFGPMEHFESAPEAGNSGSAPQYAGEAHEQHSPSASDRDDDDERSEGPLANTNLDDGSLQTEESPSAPAKYDGEKGGQQSDRANVGEAGTRPWGPKAFFQFLKSMEKEKIVTIIRDGDPKVNEGVQGWDVVEGRMEEWQARRKEWFMQGKTGAFKANSLWQVFRRLGFFPVEKTQRASHGYDFERSSSFHLDHNLRSSYEQTNRPRTRPAPEPPRDKKRVRRTSSAGTAHVVPSQAQDEAPFDFAGPNHFATGPDHAGVQVQVAPARVAPGLSLSAGASVATASEQPSLVAPAPTWNFSNLKGTQVAPSYQSDSPLSAIQLTGPGPAHSAGSMSHWPQVSAHAVPSWTGSVAPQHQLTGNLGPGPPAGLHGPAHLPASPMSPGRSHAAATTGSTHPLRLKPSQASLNAAISHSPQAAASLSLLGALGAFSGAVPPLAAPPQPQSPAATRQSTFSGSASTDVPVPPIGGTLSPPMQAHRAPPDPAAPAHMQGNLIQPRPATGGPGPLSATPSALQALLRSASVAQGPGPRPVPSLSPAAHCHAHGPGPGLPVGPSGGVAPGAMGMGIGGFHVGGLRQHQHPSGHVSAAALHDVLARAPSATGTGQQLPVPGPGGAGGLQVGPQAWSQLAQMATASAGGLQVGAGTLAGGAGVPGPVTSAGGLNVEQLKEIMRRSGSSGGL